MIGYNYVTDVSQTEVLSCPQVLKVSFVFTHSPKEIALNSLLRPQF